MTTKLENRYEDKFLNYHNIDKDEKFTLEDFLKMNAESLGLKAIPNFVCDTIDYYKKLMTESSKRKLNGYEVLDIIKYKTTYVNDFEYETKDWLFCNSDDKNGENIIQFILSYTYGYLIYEDLYYIICTDFASPFNYVSYNIDYNTYVLDDMEERFGYITLFTYEEYKNSRFYRKNNFIIKEADNY